MELDKIMEEGAKKKFQAYTEEDARTKTHFSFGKYINARWSIQEGKPPHSMVSKMQDLQL
jgi:hypothetical protein